VKEEDDDAVSLPSQDTDTEGQTHYCSSSMMRVAGGEDHGLDNGDAIGIDVFAVLAKLLMLTLCMNSGFHIS
jgi:hypothetical protein